MNHYVIYHRNELTAIFNKYFDENESIRYHNTKQKHDFHSFTVSSEVGKIDQTQGQQIMECVTCSFEKYLFKVIIQEKKLRGTFAAFVGVT